jgi:hypothetical protein
MGAPAVLLARAGLAVAAEAWTLWLTRAERQPALADGGEHVRESA